MYFEVVKLLPTMAAIFNILFLTICIGAVKSIWNKKGRISHLLMFAAGLFLLSRLGRFSYEFLLLSLPVARGYIPDFTARIKNAKKLLIAAFLIILFYSNFANKFNNPPKYPLAPNGLPVGITAFLNHIPAKGSILNHPNTGGYLQWELYPKYKISMDMEVPFLFTDEDMFNHSNLFTSEKMLKRFISEYEPSFITVPIRNNTFKDAIKKFPDYILVFFDDVEVLYINKIHYPEIAEGYELKEIDPFNIIGKDIDALSDKKKIETFKDELLKIIEIYPSGRIANQVMAMLYNKEKEYEKALPYEDAIINNYPEMAIGYRLKGISLDGLGRVDEALSYYKKALEKADGETRRGIQREIGLAYLKLKDYKKGYKALKEGINIFAPNTSYKDLYDLASAAFMLGKTEDAVFIYRLAYEKVPLDDTEWQEKLTLK